MDESESSPEVSSLILAQEYESALSELVINSKTIINTLTMVAGENIQAAEIIVSVIEKRIKIVDVDKILPIFYLLDSICKNVGDIYIQLFSNHIDELFIESFTRCTNPSTRNSMLRLLNTWNGVFPLMKLNKINAQIQSLIPSELNIPKPQNVPTRKPVLSQNPSSSVKNVNKFMNHSSTNAISSNISVPNIQSTSSNATLNYQHILNEIQQQLKHPLSYQDLLLLLDQVNKLQIQQQTQALAQQIQAQIFALSRGAPSLPTQPMYLPDNPLGHLLTPLSQPSPFPYTIPTTGIISRVNPLISSTPLINPSTLTNILPNTSTTIPSYFRSNMESNLSGNIQLAPSLSTRNSAPIITPPIQSSNKLSKPFVTPTSQVESEDIFSLDILNTKNDNAINSLYFAFPLQCKSCGLRFLDRETMNPHLDWHFQQNKKQKEKSMKASSRNWYLIKQDWITDDFSNIEKTINPFFGSEMNNNLDEINKENVLNNVPADESQTHCPICQEKFEQYWSTEQEEWIYKDSISIAGVIYHQQCTKLQNPNINPPIKEESSIPPLESHDTTSSNLLPQKRTRETEDGTNEISKKIKTT